MIYYIYFRLLVFDCSNFNLVSSVDNRCIPSTYNRDCINSTSIHPYCAVAVTASGQRHFDENFDDSDNNYISGEAVGDNNCTELYSSQKFSTGLQVWALPKIS